MRSSTRAASALHRASVAASASAPARPLLLRPRPVAAARACNPTGLLLGNSRGDDDDDDSCDRTARRLAPQRRGPLAANGAMTRVSWHGGNGGLRPRGALLAAPPQHARELGSAPVMLGGLFVSALLGKAIIQFAAPAIAEWYAKPRPLKRYKGGFNEAMDRREAALILGIRDSAEKVQVLEAYKRLMKINHPDLGGSSFVSSKINDAKDHMIKGLP